MQKRVFGAGSEKDVINHFPDASKSSSNLPSDFWRIVLPSNLNEVLSAVPVNLSADVSPAINSKAPTKKANTNGRIEWRFLITFVTAI